MAKWLSLRPFLQIPELSLAPAACQAELLIIVGRISHKQAPVLQRTYVDLQNPTRTLHISGCNNHLVGYATLRDPTRLLPIDRILSDCPPKHDLVLNAIHTL